MTNSVGAADSRLLADSFVPAETESVRRCPARSDFIELNFVTPYGRWKWCCAEPDEETLGESTSTLAITDGPYGVRARYVEDGSIGFTASPSEAAAMILAGARVYLARMLVERGR